MVSIEAPNQISIQSPSIAYLFYAFENDQFTLTVFLFADEFNRGIILPTIIKQLKSILQQYPDDGHILKVRDHYLYRFNLMLIIIYVMLLRISPFVLLATI